jgi:hypothetical protein
MRHYIIAVKKKIATPGGCNSFRSMRTQKLGIGLAGQDILTGCEYLFKIDIRWRFILSGHLKRFDKRMTSQVV